MKKLFMLLFLFPAVLFCQSRYSITINSGAFFPNSSNFKLGLGGLFSFAYHPDERFSVYLSGGYSAWGYRIVDKYNIRVFPVILGMRYVMFEKRISPYISGEFQYINCKIDRFYDFDPGTGLPLSVKKQETFGVADYGAGIGAGIMVPLNERWGFNIGSVMLLTAKNPEIYNIRTMFGLSYNFY